MKIALGRAVAIALVLLCAPAMAQAPDRPEAVLRWINAYRHKPAPQLVPQIVKALSAAGAFREPENSSIYLGFVAGVLAANPKSAKSLLDRMTPLPFQDQWLLVRAVAFSGHPTWRDLLRQLAVKMPQRHRMIEMYLTGRLPTLDRIPLKAPRKTWNWNPFATKKQEERAFAFESDPELIDVLWGVYFATGDETALMRLVSMLPWAVEKNNVDRLSAGSMVKFTLATNGSRDLKLLKQLKQAEPAQPPRVRKQLQEVIVAAETSETQHIRKQALAAVENLRRRGPESKRAVAWWGGLGESAVALGCLTAAATGQMQFGIPCVVGGALSSAAIRQLAKPD